jgi:hypothetical protein
MNFSLIARIVAAVCMVLFALFCFVPQLYAPTYGVEADAGAVFITRRASPMFFGLALILWVTSSEPVSRLRDMVVIATAVIFAGVATTGLLAYLSGQANQTILVAALAEGVLASLLLRANASDR